MNPISTPAAGQPAGGKNIVISRLPFVRCAFVPRLPGVEAAVLPVGQFERKVPLAGRDRVLAQKSGSPPFELVRTNLCGVRSDRILLPLGLRDRVAAALTDAGWSVSYRTVEAERANPPHAEWDKPRWDLLESAGFTFRYRQRELLEAIVAHEDGRIESTTGGGKTEMMKYLCVLFPFARVLISAKADLINSTIYPKVREIPNVGVFTSKSRVNVGARVICCSADSLHRMDPQRWDILLVDEADQAVTDKYALALMRFGRVRMYGLSGSFGLRDDGLAIREEALFGPVRFRLTGHEGLKNNLVARVYIVWRSLHGPDPIGKRTVDDTTYEREAVWRYARRNEQIAKDARAGDTYRKFPVMVVCRTVEQQYVIRALLPEARTYHAPDALSREAEGETLRDRLAKDGYLAPDDPGPTKDQLMQARYDLRDAKPGIYIVLVDQARGTDVPALGHVVNASAVSSAQFSTQLSGRPARLFKGKPYGKVYDYLDEYNPRAARRAKKRLAAYAAANRTNVLPANYRRTRNG